MTKVIRCKDVGFDCPGVIRAETDEQAIQMAAAHAKEAHNVQTLTPEIVEKVKAALHDE